MLNIRRIALRAAQSRPRRALIGPSRVTVIALPLVLAAVSAPAVTYAADSPTAILRGDRREGAAVRVRGTVANTRVWTAPSGARYFRFHLSDGRLRLPVLFSGAPRCAESAIATVTGIYRQRRVVEGRILPDHIEARALRCESRRPS